MSYFEFSQIVCAHVFICILNGSSILSHLHPTQTYTFTYVHADSLIDSKSNLLLLYRLYVKAKQKNNNDELYFASIAYTSFGNIKKICLK